MHKKTEHKIFPTTLRRMSMGQAQGRGRGARVGSGGDRTRSEVVLLHEHGVLRLLRAPEAGHAEQRAAHVRGARPRHKAGARNCTHAIAERILFQPNPP